MIPDGATIMYGGFLGCGSAHHIIEALAQKGTKEVIVAMEHTAKGNPKILKKCRLPYTAVHCITKIITEMCVINVTDKGLELVEINPEFTVEQVQAATEATLIVSPDLKPMC